MAKIRYDYNDVDDSGSAYDGEEPTPGIYTGKVVGAEVGKSSKNNPMITVQIDITSGDYKGWRGWHYLVQTEESLWKTKEFTDAIGLTQPGKKKGVWDTDDAIGKSCRIKIKREMYEGAAVGKIKSVLAPKKNADDDEGEDEPVVEETPAEETVEEESEAASDEDVWSWADLEGMDRDALKATIRTEQLEVKVMRSDTDEALRAKVAEALGVDVPEGDGESDEEPF